MQANLATKHHAKGHRDYSSSIPLTAKTSFHLDTQRNEATYLSSIDFDGDDIKDPASYLKYNEAEKTYTLLEPSAASEATHMGIYFTTGVETDSETNLAIPSIIRAVDRVAQHKNKGLLKTINTVDLAQTDLFVFRVSSGQLITSHKGVDQNTLDDNHTQGGTFPLNGKEGAFNFQFAMRGPDDYWNAFNPYPDYAGWASATKVTKPFQKRNADHIRPGEQLQLVAINRASGYIGSVKFTSKQVGVGGDINNALDTIIMRPPNLKIWAERVHEIKQGKQVAGEKESTNLIGNEGITLEDDLAVSIHTEWLDYNGQPLPAELADFGYTARIAKVTSAPTPDLDALKQNSSNEFAIKPGRNLNVLQFNQKELSRHHFYVQVNPYPKSQQNDFGSDIYNPIHKNYLPDGSGTDEHELPSVENTDLEGTQTTQANPLRYRPAHYVPFKVPLFDEQYSQIQQDVYRNLKEQGKATSADKPDPLYRWYYRPELQFSQYNFDAKSLIVNQTDEGGTESTTEIKIEDEGTDFGPVFDDYTDSVELLFDLLGPELDRLPALENDREFVLSLGGEEAIATIGADGKVTFNNPDHLTQLTEEDLLSLRLYLNGDAGNILWEYAFGLFGLVGDTNRDSQIVINNTSTATTPTSQNSSPSGAKKDTQNSKEYPLLVWVNDDDDLDEVSDSKNDGSDVPGKISPDAGNLKVDGMRDLVDFFPIYLDVASAIESFPPHLYKYKLREASGSLNYFVGEKNSLYIEPYHEGKSKRPDAILKHQPTAATFADAVVTTITALGVELDSSFVLRAGLGFGGILYVEASLESPLDSPIELVLDIEERTSGSTQGSASFWIQARPVQEMFRHINLQQLSGLKSPSPADGFANKSIPESYPDDRNNPDYFVFLHGFGVDGEAAKGWHSEVFKRLYRLGFDGRFIGVTWHGKVGIANYHESVYNAFVTSSYLKKKIQAVTPDASSLTIAAHSLGNMVVSNAIAHEGLDPTNYFMINAAVSIESYDDSQLSGACGTSNKMKNCMVEEDWIDYQNLGLDKLFASEWHSLFDDDDPRKNITWKNQFSSVLNTNVFNFYSPGDDVVENAVEGESVLSSIWKNGLSRHAWVNQEIGKGCQNILFGPLNAPCQAGWEFNIDRDDLKIMGKKGITNGPHPSTVYRRLSASEVSGRLNLPDGAPDKLTDEHLAQYGFFYHFEFDQLYAPISEGNNLKGNDFKRSDVEDLMNDDRNLWSLLAHAIPARSYAAAVNPLDGLQDDLINKNVNMHNLRETNPSSHEGYVYWPRERLDNNSLLDDWLHSDFRNMALPYVFKMYEKMLDIGRLREVQQ